MTIRRVAIGLLLVGCETAVPLAHAPAPAPVPDQAPTPGSSGIQGFEALGSSCTPRPSLEISGTLAGVDCNAGRVSRIAWRLADVVGSPPEDQVIAERVVQGDSDTRLVVTREAVWMRVADHAARPRGSTWMALPAVMTDAQRADAQRLAGVKESPPLKSAAEWKEALIQQGPIPPPDPKPAPKGALPRPMSDEKTGVIDPTPINAEIAKHCGAWSFDDVLAHLTHSPGPDRMKLEMEVFEQGDPALGGASADEARVVVQRDDLLDDSLRAERHFVTLKRRTGDCAGWFVESARTEWRCVRGPETKRWLKSWCP